jgi:nanoRNase/pAp phosphatase (c-di-AMP/oligoRNAs hydrolase)
VGELCLSYNGGGHTAAGTCQVGNEEAQTVLQELVARINADEKQAAASRETPRSA